MKVGCLSNMKYEIISKHDPLSGANLVVRIPSEELDKKALYTIQYDAPAYLVPVQSHNVDGKIELTYRLGERSKLRYYNGRLSPDEYIAFWESLLQPLLDCDDWFLKPFSFVLDPDYLYRDRSGSVSYLYIPSLQDHSSYEDLKNMVAHLAKDNSVSDPGLENAVLRMLVQDFQPKSFLETLRKSVTSGNAVVKSAEPARSPIPAPAPAPERDISPAPTPEPPKPAAPPIGESQATPSAPGEIHIDLGGGAKGEKKKGFSLFGAKEDKKKDPKGKKQKAQSEVAQAPQPIPDNQAPKSAPAPAPVVEPPIDVRPMPVVGGGDETQLEEFETCLRLIGRGGLPPMIAVNIEIGGAFTIGRVDISIGRKQSDFEFDSGTKAISRHHAAIERDVDGYTITDLSSKAGTYVDGQTIQPNVPYRLRKNMRISFGNGGADYIWEE